MVTDFPDYQEKYGVTPSQIREQAEEPGIGANEVAVLAGDLQADGRRVGATIEGAPAEGTIGTVVNQSAEARQLAVDGLYAVALIKEFAGQAEEFDTEVEAINTLLHQRIGAARSQARQDAPAGEDPAPVNESAIKADLQPRYNRAEEALETAADNAQTAFTNAEANGPSDAEVRRLMVAGLISLDALPLFPHITLTDEQRVTAIRNELSFMSPEEQAEYVRTHTDLPPEAADAVVPEAQEILASQVAGDIRGTAETQIDIDAETVRILAFLQNQEPFATALYTDVTPTEMADAIKRLNDSAFPIGPPATDGEAIELYDKFMNAAGVALATYTTTMSSDQRDDRDAEAVSLANEWVRAITDDENPENAGALTLLMREGGEAGGEFNATFIDHVASGVLDWERSHDGDPVWGPRNINLTDPDASFDEDTGFYNGRNAGDGLANLLGAMGNSPEGAQRFFMDSDGTVDEGRLEYLMLDRTFSHMDGSDEGDGLGEALQAAIMGGHDGLGDWNRDEADRLTNEVFELIAHNSGVEDKDDLSINRTEGGDFDGDGDDAWHPWTDMTDSLGAIAAGYADDIYQTVAHGTPGDEARLTLSQTDLLRVVAEIGHTENKTGLETMLAAVANEGINREVGGDIEAWRNSLGPNDPANMTTLLNADTTLDVSSIGSVLGELINASNDAQRDEEITAETQQAYIAKAFEFGTSFIPGPGDYLAQGTSKILENGLDFAQNEAIGQMQSAIEEAPPSSAEEYHNNARTNMYNSLRYALANEFLEHGLLTDAQPNGEGKPQYPGVPDSILTTDENGRRVFNTDLFFHRTSDANSDWTAWEDSEPADIIANEYAQTMTGQLDTILNQGG